MGEKVPIEISKDLYERLKKALSNYEGFNSVEELVEFVLNEFVSEVSEEGQEIYSPEEEEEIKKRLRSLGYL